MAVILDSNLRKKSPRGMSGLHRWQKRRFVLFSERILYGPLCGGASLQSVSGDVPLTSVTGCRLLPTKHEGRRFNIELGDHRTFHLLAESREDAARWVCEVNLHIDRAADMPEELDAGVMSDGAGSVVSQTYQHRERNDSDSSKFWKTGKRSFAERHQDVHAPEQLGMRSSARSSPFTTSVDPHAFRSHSSYGDYSTGRRGSLCSVSSGGVGRSATSAVSAHQVVSRRSKSKPPSARRATSTGPGEDIRASSRPHPSAHARARSRGSRNSLTRAIHGRKGSVSSLSNQRVRTPTSPMNHSKGAPRGISSASSTGRMTPTQPGVHPTVTQHLKRSLPRSNLPQSPSSSRSRSGTGGPLSPRGSLQFNASNPPGSPSGRSAFALLSAPPFHGDGERKSPRSPPTPPSPRSPRSPRGRFSLQHLGEPEAQSVKTSSSADTENSLWANGGGYIELKYEDLFTEEHLCEGKYGQVYIAHQRNTPHVRLLQTVDRQMTEFRSGQQVMHVLGKLRHPYMMRQIAWGETSLMQWAAYTYPSGGDLFSYVRSAKGFDEHCAQFYAAELIDLVLHLHSQGLTMPRLSPDVLFITREGHLQVTDFDMGLPFRKDAEFYRSRVEFCAPEFASSDHDDATSDWWRVGGVLYTMLTGRPPISVGSTHEDTLDNVADPSRPIRIPHRVSRSCADLLEALLTRDPVARAAAVSDRTIRDHPFFSNIDWNSISQRRLLPPSTVPDLIRQRQRDDDASSCASGFTGSVYG